MSTAAGDRIAPKPGYQPKATHPQGGGNQICPDDREACQEACLCLAALAHQVDLLKQRILQMDRQIMKWHRTNDLSRKLGGIPDVGPFVATASAVSIPDPGSFAAIPG